MKKPSGKDRGKGLLDDEDAALWEHAARTIAPLKKKRTRVASGIAAVDPSASAAAAAPLRKPGQSSKEPPKKEPAVPKPTVPAPKPALPAIATFNRTTARKIRTGRTDIEARIDLHGMYQAEAHEALRRFVIRAYERDYRVVLVITGKGKAGGSDRDVPFVMHESRERGVLKRNVPRWLEEADLRPLILSYTTASIAHGGEGALYVHLRKRR